MTPPRPGVGEPRDVWPLRQEMQGHISHNRLPQFTPAEILRRLDGCHPTPRHDELLRECRALLSRPLSAPSAASWNDLLRRVDAALNDDPEET